MPETRPAAKPILQGWGSGQAFGSQGSDQGVAGPGQVEDATAGGPTGG